jgi:hypothetical protein
LCYIIHWVSVIYLLCRALVILLASSRSRGFAFYSGGGKYREWFDPQTLLLSWCVVGEVVLEVLVLLRGWRPEAAAAVVTLHRGRELGSKDGDETTRWGNFLAANGPKRVDSIPIPKLGAWSQHSALVAANLGDYGAGWYRLNGIAACLCLQRSQEYWLSHGRSATERPCINRSL